MNTFSFLYRNGRQPWQVVLTVEAKLRLIQCAKVRGKASIRCSVPNCVQVGLQQVRLQRSVPAEAVENLMIDNANVREREEHKLTVPVRIQTPTRPGIFDALDAHYPVWRLRHTTRRPPARCPLTEEVVHAHVKGLALVLEIDQNLQTEIFNYRTIRNISRSQITFYVVMSSECGSRTRSTRYVEVPQPC